MRNGTKSFLEAAEVGEKHGKVTASYAGMYVYVTFQLTIIYKSLICPLVN
jgi:hypothetical protein